MSALVFTLREPPAQRLDLSPLVPDRLTRMSEGDIARIELGTTRARVCAGDIFKIRPGDAADIRFEGGSERFDRVGAGMTGGAIHVDGDVGIQAGRLLRGGKLTISGNAGPLECPTIHPVAPDWPDLRLRSAAWPAEATPRDDGPAP